MVPLMTSARELASKYIDAQSAVDQRVSAATQALNRQKRYLEAILLDLSEGVIVASMEHRVLLCNQAAVRILRAPDELGLGRSLLSVLTKEPLDHALEQLTGRLHDQDSRALDDRAATLPFVCATLGSESLLAARMGLVQAPDGTAAGYVLSLSDISKDVADLAKRDVLLRGLLDKARRSVASIRAASEVILNDPDMDAKDRSKFDEIINKEACQFSDQIETAAHEYQRLTSTEWPLNDVFSLDLMNCVKNRLRKSGTIDLSVVGMPLWFRGESQALVMMLEYLLNCIHERTSVERFEAEALLSDRNVYLELTWQGPPIPSEVLVTWADKSLEGVIGGRTSGDILRHHGSEIWSGRKGRERSYLRVPVPEPRRQQFRDAQEVIPERPEFYDFELRSSSDLDPELQSRALGDVSYVVFDTETTGLKPSEGDEILSIAGVRIVNRRLLTGETFDRLVNPRRDIPKGSIRFHGISQTMVSEKPPIQVVLPQFRAFVGDAVLVAHNAAFDMKFIKLKEPECGVTFDNPVLDTLLLSAFLHDDASGHDLDSVCQRFGIEISGRHTALGDAMATAGILLRMIELLEARGITTLKQALDTSSRIVEIRKQQARF